MLRANSILLLSFRRSLPSVARATIAGAATWNATVPLPPSAAKSASSGREGAGKLRTTIIPRIDVRRTSSPQNTIDRNGDRSASAPSGRENSNIGRVAAMVRMLVALASPP